MATEKKAQPEKKSKRRLRAAPTLREQTTVSETKSNKPSRFKRAIQAPFRFIGRLVARAAKAVAASRVGKTGKKIGKSRAFAPVRFLGRILYKILLISYFKGSWQELKQVIWPSARTTWHLTGAVLVFGIFFGLLVAGLDFVFEKAFREVLLGK